MSRRSAAAHLLDGLGELGVTHLFANLGTDHVSLVEELARREQEGRRDLGVVVCPHEVVTLHMAGGYAAMTGRGQAALVHVDAGTANAAMSLHNLARARLPVLLMAGRAPFALRGELPAGRDNYVHYVQDPFDIGSLARPYAKWEYCLPSGAVVRSVLGRAHAVMQSDPPGPVYLTLPREVLAAEWEDAAVRRPLPHEDGPVRAVGVDPATARRIAHALMAAESPVAFVGYLGRNSAGPAVLEALAREAGMRVVESSPHRLNLAHDSPCHAGFDPGPLLRAADLGLLVDVDVPWVPASVTENATARWMQIDIDAVKAGFPLWGFPAELRVQADSTTVLAQVLEIVRAEADDGFRTRVAARIASWQTARQERARRLAEAAATPGERDAITPDFLCGAIAREMRADDILLNETIRNTGVVLCQVPRTLPQTYFGLAGGGLGFSGGMALGAKLARPDARVVQLVGDGSFHFCAPDAVYSVADAYRLPILTVVFDNGGWAAVKQATLRVHPQGAAAASDQFFSRLGGGRRRFEQVAQAFGAHGEYVDDPEQVAPALRRCFAAIERGQAAVLTARVTKL
jgi:acetolactate synthase I/II/III large subunit